VEHSVEQLRRLQADAGLLVFQDIICIYVQESEETHRQPPMATER
jgi:hypothetical protein